MRPALYLGALAAATTAAVLAIAALLPEAESGAPGG